MRRCPAPLSQNPKVSALVTEKTRERIKRLAADLGYTPNLMAKGFATGSTATLGLLTYQLNREICGTYADEILKAADRRNYQILVTLDTFHRSPAPPGYQSGQIQQMMARGVDGLLIHTRGEGGESGRLLKAVEGLLPVVTFVLSDEQGAERRRAGRDGGFFRSHGASDPARARADRVHRHGLEPGYRGFRQGTRLFPSHAKSTT